MSLRFRDCLIVAAVAAAPVLAVPQQGTKQEPTAQPTKEALHEELLGLARQISELRSSAGPARRLEELSSRYAAISRSLGGDDPASLIQRDASPSTGSGPHSFVVPPSCGGAAVTTVNVPGVGGPINTPAPFQGVTFTTVVSGVNTYCWD